MAEAVIVGGLRTPFTKAGGPLNETPAPELGRLAARELIYRLNLRPADVDELIAGSVANPPEAANVARVIALRAGIPQDRIAHTVSRNCASGMESVTEAIDRVTSGRAACVLALGVDSMSNIPVFWSKQFAEKLFKMSTARSGLQKLSSAGQFRPRDLKPQIGIQLGLTDPVSGLMMGDTADKLSREYGITREEQDSYACRSHHRAVTAWKENRLGEETMTVYSEPNSKPVAQDVGPREGQTIEALARLRPYFDRRWGTVTVGNACQVTDGGVALMIMEASRAKSFGLTPLARVRSYAYAGCDPSRMGLGPVYSSAKALREAGLKLNQMELIELNEAFAAQVLACLKCFESPPADCVNGGGADLLGAVDQDKLNVNGGAIALGHPVGASGARLVLTLMQELGRRQQNLGLATLCVGGGQGGAVVLERLNDAA